MAAAVFGLLGVIAGGAITAGTAVFFETRRERREFKRAGRLVAAELFDASLTYGALAQSETWPHLLTESTVLSTAVWEESSPHLAIELDDSVWQELVNVYVAARSDLPRLIHEMSSQEGQEISAERKAELSSDEQRVLAVREKLLGEVARITARNRIFRRSS